MKVVPGKKYTTDQLRRLVDQSTAAELVLQGYALRHDVLDGTWTVVHWTHAGGGEDFGSLRRPRVAVDRSAFEKPPLVKKRTPQERVDSLMLRFIDDCKKAGTVPGLDDARVAAIVGSAWLNGRTEVTAEVVRKVAQYFLEDADRRFEASESKKVVRTAPSD